MIKKFLCTFMVMSMVSSAIPAVFAGNSTPPTYEQRAGKTRETVDLTDDNSENKTSRPVVDLTQYNTQNKRPERPVVDVENNNSEKTTSKPPKREIDISGGTNERPKRPVVDIDTREESEIMEEELVQSEKTDSSVYLDVTENHINYQAINSLTEKNILSGNGTGYFKPDNQSTANKRPERPIVDIDENESDETDGSQQPERPVVDLTESEDIDISGSQRPSRPVVDLSN